MHFDVRGGVKEAAIKYIVQIEKPNKGNSDRHEDVLLLKLCLFNSRNT
jgi:hypothetical protein